MPATHEPAMSDRLLADDEQVLSDVLRSYGPAIRALLCRKYNGVFAPTDIDDVLSIGLYRLWKNRGRYDRRKGSLRVWFFRIVDNAARDVLKLGWQRARQMEVTTKSSELEALADHRDNGRDGSGTLSAKQMDVREIVANLPETQRQIVLADALARDDTASSQLLGEELGIPASTVRVYRKRALDKIRSELKRRGYHIP